MSNASEIRMYFKELMEDSMEHSSLELFAYAGEQNSEAHFTEGMLTGAFPMLRHVLPDNIIILQSDRMKIQFRHNTINPFPFTQSAFADTLLLCHDVAEK